jgi:hypothetical protein
LHTAWELRGGSHLVGQWSFFHISRPPALPTRSE